MLQGSEGGTDSSSIIRKTAADRRATPSFLDYAGERQRFSWEAVGHELQGAAGAGGGVNIAAEAVEQYGVGFECDNCYGVCPDNAVIKLGPGKRFEFNYDYCKGCGMCVTECPCGAIKIEAEEI